MDDVAIEAEEVTTKEFSVGFRGYSQHDVRAFLAQVAAELAASKERERLQHERLEAAEARAESRPLSDEEVEVALGREAGRVLQAAREAAAEIRARAEEQVARLVRDASGEGSRAQQEAESLLARRTEEAEKAAAAILAGAEAQATEEIDRAKAEGRAMVTEAQAVRERVLKDLARRRRVAHQQLEQLRAGRERLLEAYRVVRSTLDEATRELTVAEVEARAAAERAALRAASLPETTVEEIEAEFAGARDIGFASVPTARFVGVGQSHSRNGSGTFEQKAVTDPEPDPEPAFVAEPEPELVAELEFVAEGVPELALVAETEPEPEPVAETEPAFVAEPEPDVEPESDPEQEPEGDVFSDLLPAPEPDAGAEVQAEVVEPEVVEPEVVEPEVVEPEVLEPEVVEPEFVGSQIVEPEPEPEPEPEVRVRPEATAGTTPSFRPTSETGVEALFARLRAERAVGSNGATAPPSENTSPVAPDPVTNAPEPAAPAEADATDDEDEDVLQARDGEVADIERSLAKALKRALADEQNEVLDILRRSRGVVPLVDLLPSPSDHTARYLAVAGPELRTGARRGVAIGGEPPSIDDLAVSLAATVAEDLRSRLQRALEAADGDEGPMVEGISAAYREWKTARIEPLARHHVSAAHSRGRFAASTGRLRWVVDGEEGPCPDCDDNALAGGIEKGQPFPTGQQHPPAHVGCRCTIVGDPG